MTIRIPGVMLAAVIGPIYLWFKRRDGFNAVIYNNIGTPVSTLENLAPGITSFKHNLPPGIYTLSYFNADKPIIVRFSIK